MMIECRNGEWRMGIAGLFAVVVLTWGSAAFTTAADSPNDELKLTTDRVVVFKDGYYLALKSGTAIKSGFLSRCRSIRREPTPKRKRLAN